MATIGIKNGLCLAKVMHKRMQPKENQFVYSVFYLCFPLKNVKDIAGGILSLNRFNILGFYEKDHGAKDGSSLEKWIRDILEKEGVKEADGDIVLMTYPRVLGYVFNPVSFWFCLDKQGKLRAVLAEVNNTFGESHNYLISHPDNREIKKDEWLIARKVFHVSPFMEVEGTYKFRFAYSDDVAGVWLDYDTEKGEMLKTWVVGKRIDLNKSSIMKAFLKHPLVTLKTIFLIHYQAVRLILKGIWWFKKPKPPAEGLTR